MTYFGKHWRGELSLAKSFWVNVFLINIGISIFDVWLTESSSIENPVVGSQIAITYAFVRLAIVYPWQVIGMWRSANRHVKETKKGFWSSVVKVVVVFGLIGTLGNVSISWPVYKHQYQTGFGKDEYGDYSVVMNDAGTLIHLKGGLGFGISKEVRHLVAKNPNVKGIILDSAGGRIYEGRELSKIILINGLDTYTLNGCYSACGTAFISGNKRYLAKGANLAFHQYYLGGKKLDPYVDVSSEQQNDLMIYQRRGISQGFIDKIFKAKQDDLWYPTIEEMLDAGVVHEVVNSSSVNPINYDSFNKIDLEKEFKDLSVFQAIKKYEPKTYQQILKSMESQVNNGASILEIQQETGGYIDVIASKALPSTSNNALTIFVRETINISAMLENEDPILCMKYLFPKQYGSLELAKYLSKKQMMPMSDALSFVIADSYKSNNAKMDTLAAEELISRVNIQLGDDASFLAAQGLRNRKEYSKACKVVIHFYELILSNNIKVAGNGLRYIFSP